MLLKKIFGAGLGVVLLTSSLATLILYIFASPSSAQDAPATVNDLSQIPELLSLNLEFGASQNTVLVAAETAAGTSRLNFALQEDLQIERSSGRARSGSISAQTAVKAIYTPTNVSLFNYELPNKPSTGLSLPSNCLLTPQLVLTAPRIENLPDVNEYEAKWLNYDLAGRSLKAELLLPVFDKSTVDVTDDCFVIERSWQITPPDNWPLFVLTGGAESGAGCRGLFIVGRGGDDLERSPSTWICREDATGLTTEASNAFAEVQTAPSFGRYLNFIETRDDKCGGRLLISRTDITESKEEIRAQWQDWHDDCGNGQYDKSKTLKRTFDLTIVNLATRQATNEAESSVTFGQPTRSAGSQGSVESTCEFNFSGLGFGYLICWILEGLSQGLYWVEGQIENFLRVERSAYQETLGQEDKFSFKDVWGNVRDFSTYAVVGTALFMVISTALDVGLFKNYTVKKYLPRLVVGAILIQFSWALGDLFIQVFNQLGDVLEALLFASFPGAKEQSLSVIFDGGWSTTLVGGSVVGVLTYMGWATLLPILFTGMMFFLLGFLFLVARKFLIILLLILAPLGIALWVLPGNDKAWNFYFKTFFYLLAIYPLIIILISAGKIFSYLILL